MRKVEDDAAKRDQPDNVCSDEGRFLKADESNSVCYRCFKLSMSVVSFEVEKNNVFRNVAVEKDLFMF